MTTIELTPQRSATAAAAYNNIVRIHTSDARSIGLPDKGGICFINNVAFWITPDGTIEPGTFETNQFQRIIANLSLCTKYTVKYLPDSVIPSATTLTFVIDIIGTPPETQRILKADTDVLPGLAIILGHPVQLNQTIPLLLAGNTYRLRVSNINADSTIGPVILTHSTTFVFVRSSAMPSTIKFINNTSETAPPLFIHGFNFEDIGIGGLDAEFQKIFCRAFSSRLVPSRILAAMGQKHIRGMLLYGPPGCGKTLIARQIAKMLRSAPPKIVNGPELLDKFVGQSEENVRKLFADAEKEQAEKGDDSQLHIIVMDELDALVKRRGTTTGGTGVGDNIVNQFLSKIDGVDSLNNILIIGMTNRKDLLDDAILRPGRLELHVEIGLPNEAGRLQILAIHTAKLRESRALSSDVSLESLAKRTRNFTGAEIEGLVRVACSSAFAKRIDLRRLDASSASSTFDGLIVTLEDFEHAFREIKPVFGVKDDELTSYITGGIKEWGAPFTEFQKTLAELGTIGLSSSRILLTGPPKSGKTSLSIHYALNLGAPFIRRLSGADLIHMSDDTARVAAITNIFSDAYRSSHAVLILDDIEHLIQWGAIGARYSNMILQTLMLCISRAPPSACRLHVIATSSSPLLLQELGILSVFDQHVIVPLLTDASHYLAFLGEKEWKEASIPLLEEKYGEKGCPVGRMCSLATAPSLTIFRRALELTTC